MPKQYPAELRRQICERMLEGERIVEEVPTYRGEGQCFL